MPVTVIEIENNNTPVEVLPPPAVVVEVLAQPVQVIEVSAPGPQGPPGNEGFIALSGNTPVPAGTPAGTVILRY